MEHMVTACQYLHHRANFGGQHVRVAAGGGSAAAADGRAGAVRNEDPINRESIQTQFFEKAGPGACTADHGHDEAIKLGDKAVSERMAAPVRPGHWRTGDKFISTTARTMLKRCSCALKTR